MGRENSENPERNISSFEEDNLEKLLNVLVPWFPSIKLGL